MDQGGPATEANAVRDPGAEIFTFPAEAIMRRQPGDRGDQVAITHRGETRIFASPEDLEAGLRDTDPVLKRLRDQAARDLAEAEQLVRQARLGLAIADAAQAAAERRLRRIGQATILAAILAGVCILGAL